MEEKEISLKELFSVVWKKKLILGLLFIIGLASFGFGGYLYNNNNEKMITYVSLQWDGIGKGEYPNGERFEYTQAVEPYVIQAAMESQALDLNITKVRDAVTLTPVVPGDVQSVIASALESGEQISYFATEYKVCLDHKALGLTEEQARSFVEAIIIEFRDDFEKKFVSRAIILDYTDEDYTDLEYVDIATVINTQIDLINSKMELGLSQNPGFYSFDGLTFNDILVRTELIEAIELNQINSRTTSYLLAKDPEYLAVSYMYKIELKQLELDKEEQKEADAIASIAAYAGNLTQIVIPGVDQSLTIDTYYDTLIENQISIQSNIAELENDISYIQIQIDRLNGDDEVFNSTVSAQKQIDESQLVETYITSANEKLSLVVEDANSLLLEYNQFLTSNIIKPLMTPVVDSGGMSSILIGIIGAILVTGVGTLVVLFKHDWK